MHYNAMHKFVVILDNIGNRKINNIKMFKLLEILKQIVNQLEQMCLGLGLKNGYTLLEELFWCYLYKLFS